MTGSSNHEPRKLFVRRLTPNSSIAVVQESDGIALYREDERVGQIRGDADLFVLLIDGARRLVCAGPAEREAHVITRVITPDDEQECPVYNGVWLSDATRFEPPMNATLIWLTRDGELFRRDAQITDAEEREPLFGPSWTYYGE